MKKKVTNRYIAGMLRRMGFIREVDGKDWSARSYFAAADKVEVFDRPLRDISADELKQTDGFGDKIAKLVWEIAHHQLKEDVQKEITRYPDGVYEFANVPGIGPRKAVSIFDEYGVKDMKGLGRLANSGKLGAGLTKSIEFALDSGGQRLSHKEARQIAYHIRNDILKGKVRAHLLKEVESDEPMKCAVVGSIRRKEKTVGDIDILLASNNEGLIEEVQRRFMTHGVKVCSGPQKCSIYFEGKIRVDLLTIPTKHWGASLIYFTGSKEHNIALRRRALQLGLTLNEFGLYDGRRMLAGSDERDLYSSLGLEWMPPNKRKGSRLVPICSDTP